MCRRVAPEVGNSLASFVCQDWRIAASTSWFPIAVEEFAANLSEPLRYCERGSGSFLVGVIASGYAKGALSVEVRLTRLFSL